MRRLIAVLSACFAAVLLMSTPALAAPHAAHAVSHVKAKHKSHAKPHAKPKPKAHDVTLVGVISDTPTATIGSGTSDTPTATITSDTATSTITITVKGGDRAQHGAVLTLTLDKSTVVRRGEQPATAADLQLGDHVSVRARKAADGTWHASRVNAAVKEQSD